MRVLITILTLFISLNSALAQNESIHMKFMGIPMDCGIESFAKKLESEKGLRRIEYDRTDALVLTGSFAGYNDCSITLLGDSNSVISVAVSFPAKDMWSLIYPTYTAIKSNLEAKYGEPTSVNESFGEFEPSTDFGKLNAIKEGNASFETLFDVRGGRLLLQILSKYGLGFVLLQYVDVINLMEQQRGAINDL